MFILWGVKLMFFYFTSFFEGHSVVTFSSSTHSSSLFGRHTGSPQTLLFFALGEVGQHLWSFCMQTHWKMCLCPQSASLSEEKFLLCWSSSALCSCSYSCSCFVLLFIEGSQTLLWPSAYLEILHNEWQYHVTSF